MALSHLLTKIIWGAIGGDPTAANEVVFTGSGALASVFPVTDLASATIAAAGRAIAELIGEATGETPSATVDRRLSSMWFKASIRPLGWSLPPVWDSIAGDYQTSDGWIRLHTNAPHHRAAVERVLGAHGDKQSMARAVAPWRKSDLEDAVVETGGCAAEMRTIAEWEQHHQGRAVAAEPLAYIVEADLDGTAKWPSSAARPLNGVRVLDLTRVLAGPVATRFLAGYGADVLRIDPPSWDEPGVVPEVTLGKRCARLDLHNASERAIFETLLSNADILVHGYRPGALDYLGFDAERRRKLSPGLIDVCLDAYGWSGPWAARRGFDSLVQMSSGIADRGMRRCGADQPVPLPVQALDHAIGYLMAAVAVHGLTNKLRRRHGTQARLSLARTAKLFVDHEAPEELPLAPETESDRSPAIEKTEWGEAQRLLPPVQISGAQMWWDYPARSLGSDAPQWRDG
jgi:CoA-transferase family III